MERQIVVSGGDELNVFSLPDMTRLRGVRLEGAGALCAAEEEIFCASTWGDVIWRLHGRRLIPTGLFAGGPGMTALARSPDGRRLYALCSDADSVLMLDAQSGTPLMLARAGLNPPQFALDGEAQVLAVAGGACGEALLLSAGTLKLLGRLAMPGPVLSVALCGGTVHALCLNETLNTTMVTVERGGAQRQRQLSGMPGALLGHAGTLLAATQGCLYIFTAQGDLLGSRHAPGRAGRLTTDGSRLMLCDALGETLFALGACGGRWRTVCEPALDAAVIWRIHPEENDHPDGR